MPTNESSCSHPASPSTDMRLHLACGLQLSPQHDKPAAVQQLILQRPRRPLAPAGLHFAAVAHTGNSQSSPEERNAIVDVYRSLIGQVYQDRDGNQRPIYAADILVVTPYNAQVNLLKQMLPVDARIGTVGKFQGQEAPVCLISMATSSADELPRNIEFLFSVNRLNVAISRAQALAVVFASPRLLDVPCRTVEQMRLVNALNLDRAGWWAQGRSVRRRSRSVR